MHVSIHVDAGSIYDSHRSAKLVLTRRSQLHVPRSTGPIPATANTQTLPKREHMAAHHEGGSTAVRIARVSTSKAPTPLRPAQLSSAIAPRAYTAGAGRLRLRGTLRAILQRLLDTLLAGVQATRLTKTEPALDLVALSFLLRVVS